MRLRFAIVSATATLALTVGMSLGVPAATDAMASVHPTAATTAPLVNHGHCSSGDLSGHFVFWNGTNETADAWSCACNAATEYSSGFLDPVKSFENSCGTKVWMQEFIDGGNPPAGWSYCISPGGVNNSVGSTWQRPASFLVGRETGSC